MVTYFKTNVRKNPVLAVFICAIALFGLVSTAAAGEEGVTTLGSLESTELVDAVGSLHASDDQQPMPYGTLESTDLLDAVNRDHSALVGSTAIGDQYQESQDYYGLESTALLDAIDRDESSSSQ